MDDTKHPPLIAPDFMDKSFKWILKRALKNNIASEPVSIKSLASEQFYMKILVVGDCHGVKQELENEAEQADVILAVGDICGDSEEMREAMFQAMDLEKEWYDILGRGNARKAVENSLERGRKVLNQLSSFNKPVFIVPGNWDWDGREETWGFLAENRFQGLIDEFPNIQNINRERFQDSNFCYIGYGPCSAPEIPQYEDEKPEKEEEVQEIKAEYLRKKDKLQELFQEAEKPVIFLSHNVPHETSLDRIQNPESPADGRHYGSLIVREMIEEFQPVFSAAGHMHEGYGREQVGETLALNAGLHSHVLMELENEEVKKIDFHPSREDY